MVALSTPLFAGSDTSGQSPNSVPARPFHSRASLHVLNESWRFWVGAGTCGLAAVAFDRQIRDLAQSNHLHSGRGDHILNDGIVHLGEVYPFVVAVGALSFDGLVLENRKSLRVATEMAVSPGITHLIVGAIKAGFGRERPPNSDSPYNFFKGSDSFVSGHSATAWTWATVLAKNYPRQDADWLGFDDPQPLIPAFCYTCATLVSVQRVYDDRHWASDVVFGGIVGYFSGSLAVWLGERYCPEWLTVMPGNPVGVIITWK